MTDRSTDAGCALQGVRLSGQQDHQTFTPSTRFAHRSAVSGAANTVHIPDFPKSQQGTRTPKVHEGMVIPRIKHTCMRCLPAA